MLQILQTRLSDYYLVLLAGVLIGHAFIGESFTYLGLPPIYVREIALLTGGAIFLETGDVIAALTTLPSLLLASTLAFVGAFSPLGSVRSCM
jgi:hypothetical protein